MKAKFVVVESTPGYMSESEPSLFATFKEALAYARDLVDELLDVDIGMGDDVSPMALVSKFIEKPFASFEVSSAREHDLGRVVEVSPTDEDIELEE